MDITGAFEVPREIDNGIREWGSVLEGGCMWVIDTSNTSISKQRAQGQDGVDVKSLINLVFRKERYAALCAGY